MTDVVTYTVQGHLGLITLNNPPVNALSVSKGVLQRILDAIKDGEHDSAVRAFVVTGAGRCFSGGADISEFGKPPVVGMANLPALATYMDTVTKPIVAGIHGFALGGGLELALACHFRVAAPAARGRGRARSPDDRQRRSDRTREGARAGLDRRHRERRHRAGRIELRE